MSKTAGGRIEEQLRSAFPEGVINRVEVLSYGDDPVIEPGQTAIRVSIDRAGRPDGNDADEEITHEFERANRAAIEELRGKLPRFIGWVEFRADGTASSRGSAIRIASPGGGRSAPPLDDVPGELTPVMTRLGPADLATVDTLITAGIASSRAEIMRWAVGRIREHPVYAQIQERVQEINQLKAQF